MTLTLLLYAESLAAAGLSRLLEGALPDCPVRLASSEVPGPLPQLVIWQPEVTIEPLALLLECQRLQERWHPAPLLLVLLKGHRLSQRQLLALPALGVLEAPELATLLQAITTLRGGGRVLDLLEPTPTAGTAKPGPGLGLGLGQWLLLSGLEQIEAERSLGQRLLATQPGPLTRLVLEGRQRELALARQLLLWLWGPLSLAWGGGAEPTHPAAGGGPGGAGSGQPGRGSLSLSQ
ncbi:MAG: DUF3685 domain-containing protein, partial [Cyanobacteriota bacterium]